MSSSTSVPPRASSIAGQCGVFGLHRAKQALPKRSSSNAAQLTSTNFLPHAHQPRAKHAPQGFCPCPFRHRSAHDHQPAPDREYLPCRRSITGDCRSVSSSMPAIDNSRRSARLSSVRRRAWWPFLASSVIRSGLNGFSRKSNAPNAHRFDSHRHIAVPVIMITGKRAVRPHQLFAETASRPCPAF